MTPTNKASRPHTPRRILPLVGAHISAAGGLSQVTDRALAMGAEVVQVFNSNPRTWHADLPDPEALAAFADQLRGHRLPLFFHTIYLVNLASPERELRRRSALAVAEALVTGSLAQASGVVTHIGSHRGHGFEKAASWAQEALSTALRVAMETLADLGYSDRHHTLPPLLLETSSGSGNTVGGSLQDLAFLLAPEDSAGSDPRIHHLGLCLDTAHLFAAGYAVHQPQGLESLLSELGRLDLMKQVRLVHLNDSSAPFASRRDRHANVGEGEIGYAGLAFIVRHPALAHVPFVLEVPGSDRHGPGAADIALVKTMRQEVQRRPQTPTGVDRDPPTQA